MRTSVISIFIVMLLTGCSHKYRTDSYQAPTKTLSRDGSAYIMLARDGVYGRKTYSNSGATLSRETQRAISVHLNQVEVATDYEDRDQALSKASSANISYVIEPIILHWEDRSTHWSGRPDRITVKIVVWDPVTKKVISSGVERASSKWGTFGGDHPQDLLPRMLARYSKRLFP